MSNAVIVGSRCTDCGNFSLPRGGIVAHAKGCNGAGSIQAEVIGTFGHVWSHTQLFDRQRRDADVRHIVVVHVDLQQVLVIGQFEGANGVLPCIGMPVELRRAVKCERGELLQWKCMSS